MSVEQYDESINQSLDDNKIEDSYSNPQEGDANCNRYYYPIQSSIVDITGYFDENLLKIAVNEQTTRPKISMAAGCLILEGYRD